MALYLHIGDLAAAARHGGEMDAVLSLVDPGTPPPAAAPLHEVIEVHDFLPAEAPSAALAEDLATQGIVLPDRTHAARIVAFGERVLERARSDSVRLLVHCHAGISRSTAAAYAISAMELGAGYEAEAAERVRRAQAAAHPNALLIHHADDVLGRGGRLLAAAGEAFGIAVPGAAGPRRGLLDRFF